MGLSSGHLNGESNVTGQRTEWGEEGGHAGPAVGRRDHVTENTPEQAETYKQVFTVETSSPREEGGVVGRLWVMGDLEFQAEEFRRLLQVAE